MGAWSHLSIRVKGQTGDAVGVDVPQDGDGLHGVGVPDTDEGVLPHLTRRHLDLIRMDGETERETGGRRGGATRVFIYLFIYEK